MLLDDPKALSRGDLKNSFFEINEITDNIKGLTEGQQFILNYFNGKSDRKRMVTRGDLNPRELIKYLPNIALFNIEFDEQGNLSNIVPRLLGTALADFYGEFTGVSVHSDIVKKASPHIQDRLTAQVQAAIKHRDAISSIASPSVEGKVGIRIVTITLPMSQNNSDIDKIFMYLEVETGQ